MFGCSMFIVFRRWGERPNERVTTVGIGCALLAGDTNTFIVAIKACLLLLCQGAPVAQRKLRTSD